MTNREGAIYKYAYLLTYSLGAETLSCLAKAADNDYDNKKNNFTQFLIVVVINHK